MKTSPLWAVCLVAIAAVIFGTFAVKLTPKAPPPPPSRDYCGPFEGKTPEAFRAHELRCKIQMLGGAASVPRPD